MTTPAPAGLALPISAWGRLSRDDHAVVRLVDRDAQLPERGPPMLPFGNGRSYGDVCLNSGHGLWLTRGLDRFIRFDPQTGVLECEAGVMLDEIIELLLPRGWFLPVTPGTRFVTLGGAIANDVHGKNHHGAGTLGDHVLGLQLQRTDGQRIDCSRQDATDWLRATIGGMGLTGVILSARLQMRPVQGAWIDADTLPFDTLEEFFRLSRESESAYDYIVSWIDCVHGNAQRTRGVFFRGNHSASQRPAPKVRTRSLPFTPPFSLINAISLRAFNRAYYLAQRLRSGASQQHLMPFFYPLDSVLGWNRAYGPRGFYQYQCVVPRACEVEATRELLAAIRTSGQGSFLAVLKTFGDRAGAGLLSFPMAGTTLALDFPNQGPPTLALFRQLDAIVERAGGRLYMAKDACMSRAFCRAGYPALAEFARYRDPGISSNLARRLLDD